MSEPDLFARFIPLHEMLKWGTQELSDAGIPTARLDAEVLLGAVLGLSRAQVLARLHTTMRRHERGPFVALIHRRKRGEPVAYILGKKEFYGRDFMVDQRVLIPRPETEELVDRCLDTLEGIPAPRVADIGTGSGAIAVTLVAEHNDLVVVATDVSAEALSVARENARRYGVAGRIDFREGSLLEPLFDLPPFDLIVANLPYVGTDELELLEPDVREYEPYTALFAGPEGLDLFPAFFKQLRDNTVLKPEGVVLLEIGYAQGAALARLARSYFPEARTIAVHKDLAHHDRFVELRP
ncbi:MAG: peptide chain release factor N(5)-glutamine methyltransferase [Chloroflexota bacterium]|nr:peptide chain release factor N(5)-glutamine methyltransferase [Chloroflexota bacterium]